MYASSTAKSVIITNIHQHHQSNVEPMLQPWTQLRNGLGFTLVEGLIQPINKVISKQLRQKSHQLGKMHIEI